METKRNSFGMTKAQVDKVFHNRERTGEVRHTCWYLPCKSKAATNHCRICGGKKN